MPGKLMLSLVLIVFSGGCSNLMTAAPPDRILAGVHEFGTTALAYSPDGQRLISGGFRGDLRSWDAATQRELGTAHAHRGPVRAILPMTSGDFVSGGDDGHLILWHGGQIKAQAVRSGVTALALFQGRVVSAHRDRRLRIWTPDTLQAVREIAFNDAVVALSASGNQLAVGLDHAVVLMDNDFSTYKTLPAPRTPRDLQFSPDGRMLAAGSWFRLQVWDLASGVARSIPTEHNGLLTSVAFSPDGRHLATLGRHTDSAIRIFDTTDFRVVQRYRAHDLCGAVIRFNPDGATMASGSDDESIRLYRTDLFQTSSPRSGQAQSGRIQPSSGAIPSAH
jgi:WD40 repeat protein